jgi:hypothetical protein
LRKETDKTSSAFFIFFFIAALLFVDQPYQKIVNLPASLDGADLTESRIETQQTRNEKGRKKRHYPGLLYSGLCCS